jgi:hypothetical protein
MMILVFLVLSAIVSAQISISNSQYGNGNNSSAAVNTGYGNPGVSMSGPGPLVAPLRGGRYGKGRYGKGRFGKGW